MKWPIRVIQSTDFDLFLILWFPEQSLTRIEITGSPVEPGWLMKEMENTANLTLVRKSKLFILTSIVMLTTLQWSPSVANIWNRVCQFQPFFFVVILDLKSYFHSAHQIGEMQGGSPRPEYPRLEVTGKRFKLNLNLVDGFKRTSCQSSERISFLISKPCPERRDSSMFLWPMVRQRRRRQLFVVWNKPCSGTRN